MKMTYQGYQTTIELSNKFTESRSKFYDIWPEEHENFVGVVSYNTLLSPSTFFRNNLNESIIWTYYKRNPANLFK